jgi:hypothetical protein
MWFCCCCWRSLCCCSTRFTGCTYSFTDGNAAQHSVTLCCSLFATAYIVQELWSRLVAVCVSVAARAAAAVSSAMHGYCGRYWCCAHARPPARTPSPRLPPESARETRYKTYRGKRSDVDDECSNVRPVNFSKSRSNSRSKAVSRV